MRRWRPSLRGLRDVLDAGELAPLLLATALLPWVAIASRHWWKQGLLFHDVNMYQYGAWCMMRGERLYQDIATPDGPLIFIIHALIQLVTRTSEAAFRRADIVLQTVVAFGIGALLAPRRAGARRNVAVVVWGTTHATVWLAFVLSGDWAMSAQRESYYALFGMGAVVLCYRAVTVASPRIRTVMLVSGGAIAAAQMFGKHTGIVYVALGLIAVAADPGVLTDRMAGLRRYGIGVLAGTAFMLAFIAVVGSLRGFYFWYFRYAFSVYRYESAQAMEQLLGDATLGHHGRLAVVALVVGGVAVALRLLPRRALAFVVAPALHFAAAIAQGKGWWYQFMPVLGSVYLLFTVGLAAVWQGGSVDAPWSWAPVRAAGATALMFVVATQCLENLQASAWMGHRNYNDPLPPEKPELRQIRDGAAALATMTGPDDRVFFYGSDPVLPFQAQRLPAVPYMVPWMVTFHLSPATDTSDPDIPTPGQAQWPAIQEMQAELQDDVCTRLLRNKPKALAFIDGWEVHHEDYVSEVTEYCPDLKDVMRDRYHLDFQEGPVRIYIRQ